MKDNVRAPKPRLDLLSFTPFRLNRLATEFSSALAAEYGARFGLDIPEWRVLATLGPHDEPRSAQYVVRCTRTHKSRISRAVAHLAELGVIERLSGGSDKREVLLRLTAHGRDIYEKLVPLMLARESEILGSLSAEDLRSVDRVLGLLEAQFGLVRHDDPA
jgi:DNA-binding MarR family transcriptional regulator